MQQAQSCPTRNTCDGDAVLAPSLNLHVQGEAQQQVMLRIQVSRLDQKMPDKHYIDVHQSLTALLEPLPACSSTLSVRERYAEISILKIMHSRCAQSPEMHGKWKYVGNTSSRPKLGPGAQLQVALLCL